jgi:hypothetical protein
LVVATTCPAGLGHNETPSRRPAVFERLNAPEKAYDYKMSHEESSIGDEIIPAAALASGPASHSGVRR